MPASRGTTQMSGTLPWQRHGITTGGTSHYGGQNPPDVVPVRDLLGDDVLDVLLERSIDADGGLRLTGEGSMLGELVKAVLERALEAELSAHLGYAKDDLAGNNSGNSRNGSIGKTVQTGIGPVHLSVPRDRAGTFAPVLVAETGRAHFRRAGRHDHQPVRARHDGARHSPSPEPGVWHRAVARAGQRDHRRRGWRRCGPGRTRVLDPVWPVVFLDAIVRHEAPVRREALGIEGGVRPPRQAVAAAWWELSAVRSGRCRGWREAALTKPGRFGTARRAASGERDQTVYER